MDKDQGSSGRWKFSVDRGGTFTDVVGIDPQGRIHARKLLSESSGYEDAAIEGIRRLLKWPVGRVLPREQVEWIRLGTTVATNALLERKGAPVGLLITRGFRDLLEIGTQERPDLFALSIRKPETLYRWVEEVDERTTALGEILTRPDPTVVRDALTRLKKAGAVSLAVVFLHAWRAPENEALVAGLAQEIGFQQVSTSHETLSLIQVVGRGRTTLVDAYLSPVLLHYAHQVRQWTGTIPLHFMGSSGSLLVPDGFTGKDAILSGPAGGVLGVAAVAEQCGDRQAVGFDMGGTSTDVCRYDGVLERVLEVETAGVRYHAPMLRVETVAAGGGSILGFDGHRLTVGPESAGAAPGPACYGLGGPATITDANLLLGRLDTNRFPHLFGPERNAPLDFQAARERLTLLADAVNAALATELSPEALALGYVRIANETMAQPIKTLSEARGYDLRDHAMVCFGGAGAQHACGVARILGIRTIRIHPLSGLLSAYGIATAAHRRHHVESVLIPADQDGVRLVRERARDRAESLIREMIMEGGVGGDDAQGFQADPAFQRRIEVDLRTPGTDSPLTLPFVDDVEQLHASFLQAHRRYYGFDAPDIIPELVTVRIDVWRPDRVGNDHWHEKDRSIGQESDKEVREDQSEVWFQDEGAETVTVYDREHLVSGHVISGPALITEQNATIVVEAGYQCRVDEAGMITLSMVIEESCSSSQSDMVSEEERVDPVLLGVFNHRFMGIASQMGETLARTSHSVNIKERLDFSCAVFDHRGRLVANAPHIPVHLGAMGETVSGLLAERGERIHPGDLYVSNDPMKGGSHLPDVTVVAPIFRRGRLLFFVAARGHHADIGGIVPGSMPPFATELIQEGVVFSNRLIVREGEFLEEKVRAILGSGQWPARNLSERLSDLRAQIAACHKGVSGVERLCDLYGDSVVSRYMDHMRDNAAQAMQRVLKQFLDERGDESGSWQGVWRDAMDDGSVLQVRMEIARDVGFDSVSASVDFQGTSPQHPGNLNAPSAVVRAAVLYVFRSLVQQDIPLNDGCLEAVSISIPDGSMLSPGEGAAVSGGNVETSQRVVDILLGALGIAAASQGTMNNLLFGAVDGSGSQYYETIAGGSGAIQGESGASGVQVHMTNTRITDPEVLESRFPAVRLERFSLRTGSGGDGSWRGGDGVVRTFRFMEPRMVTLLTQRRECPPFGLDGGENGSVGINRLHHCDGSTTILPASHQCRVDAGEAITIETPGGGGFGRK
ncbi:MAG: hydantoinase B/oxoprolinase family protein [Magnetococcales bacterium]|nr:hydantoinase B/oxoprolinase family protein [Magnetococcales bacterium]